MKNFFLLVTLLITLLLASLPGLADIWVPHLRGGITFSGNLLQSPNKKSEFFPAWGIHFQAGIPLNEGWELVPTGRVQVSSTADTHFALAGETIRGKGKFLQGSYGPLIAYFLGALKSLPGQNFYLSGGPLWSMQNLKFDSLKGKKLSYSSRGLTLGLGVRQDGQLVGLRRPIHLELFWERQVPRKVSLAAIEDSHRAKIARKTSVKHPTLNTVGLLFGMTFF